MSDNGSDIFIIKWDFEISVCINADLYFWYCSIEEVVTSQFYYNNDVTSKKPGLIDHQEQSGTQMDPLLRTMAPWE